MKFWKYILSIISLIVAVVWLGAVSIDNNLHIIACDVGQGDAILITYKQTQILVDGRPGQSVTDCLGRHIPFWDREIELVVLTHPKADHYSGLIEVFKRYDVTTFMETEATNSTQGYEVLESLVKNEAINKITPDTGLKLGIGLLQLEIVYPDKNIIISNSSDLNNYSIVFKLNFGEFDALFTGDMEPAISEEVLDTNLITDTDYLKVPHHGSKNGLTQEILSAATPEIAVISGGEKNRFGHPHKEILDMLNDKNIKILRTDELGDVEIITNGIDYWVNN